MRTRHAEALELYITHRQPGRMTPPASRRTRSRTALAPVLIAAAWLAVPGTGTSTGHLSAQTSVDRRFAAAPDGLVRIWNLRGSVKVTGWDRDSVVVTGTISETGGASFFAGVGADGAKLGVWTDEPGPGLRASDLEVFVPRGSRLHVEAGSSGIDAAGITGTVDIHSVTGSIRVSGGAAEIVAETLAGEIMIEADTRSARLKTASADIRVRGTVRDVVASTISGSITVESGRYERGSFETVDGHIRYFGNVGAGTLDFVTHSGTVELHLAPAASADFLINTIIGAFDDQFGVKAMYSGNKLKGQEIRFSTGSGGGPVTIRSFKGRVVLRRRS